ncbi:MAG: protein rep, partial [Candidatus Riflebacteria bacterium]|nr:protein rep [Candidatus Riflebacteria bacterium]
MLADATLEKKKLHKGSFCGNRFCPMCAWRKARKDALKISVIMKWLEAEYDKAFVFVTLTAPNV